MNDKLKVIDFNATNQFTANGVKYTVEKDLSFARWDYFSALCVRLAYGRDYDSIQQALVKAVEHLDKVHLVKASVELNNILEGITSFPNRVDDAIAICALFINAEGEDRGVITGEMISKKKEDWTVEGLSAIPFQHLAGSLCGSLLKDWKEMEGYAGAANDQTSS